MAKTQENIALSIDKSRYGTTRISKASVKGTAELIYASILDGGKDPLTVAELFKFSSEVEKELKKLTDDSGKNSFNELVINEIKRNSDDGDSYNSRFGTKMSIMEAGYKYDYSVCNDPIYDNLLRQSEELSEVLKAREKFLKTIKGHMLISVPHPETGELLENIEVYPPAVTSTTTYKTELLKD